ncbi:MAG: TM0106 family RecB-like putative nuclease, partial [Acidobacteriaceae bacterium]|nr:TM0106 family RecB-like putative nuclease [Acidobacteriaceae bacterium]
GNGEQKTLRVSDYSAYCSHLKESFLEEMAQLESLDDAAEAIVPMPVKHCEICLWDSFCKDRREKADHLSLVARMRREQIRKLEARNIRTLEQLAIATDDQRPPNLNQETFNGLRHQAALQLHHRLTHSHKHELIRLEEKLGFGLLPEPNEGDVFFDMEGDPLYEPARNLYYLFGAYLAKERCYLSFWAPEPALEKQAFEQFVDFLVERRERYPQLHVYHYADYEKVALRKLSVQYATREDEVDQLLRGEVLVDLYAVVRQTMRVSQPKYGIKYLEALYNFERAEEVRSGDESVLEFERWRESGDNAILNAIERYNEADCRSTHELHKWLLERRLEGIEKYGKEISWRPPPTKSKAEEREEELGKLTSLQRELLEPLPTIETKAEYDLLDEDRKARWLLGQLLGYHRREEKPVWWQLFDRCEKTIAQLQHEDRDALAGIDLCTDIDGVRVGQRDRNLIYTYRFPEQEYNIGSSPTDPATRGAVTLIGIDEDAGTLQLKVHPDRAAAIVALIPGGPVTSPKQQASLEATAREYLAGTLEHTHPAVIDLLKARPPRLIDGKVGDVIQPQILDSGSIAAIVEKLDQSYLFIQGPPGTGKSTKGSEVIAQLLKDGKRVGVTANSHKAIQNLLCKVEECAGKTGVSFTGLYKGEKDADAPYKSPLENPLIRETQSNPECEAGTAQLIGGTAWLFAREEMADQLDYLFIDEAGQIALANAIAVARCAKNIVLLGDPLQLAQVSKGTHLVGAGASVLEHLLGDDPTIPRERGIFLGESYRMHPEICSFISNAVYDERLKPADRTEDQYVVSDGLTGHGLRYIPIEHSDNSRDSREEAERIVAEIQKLIRGRVKTRDHDERALERSDILVVSPYNAQRRLIRRLLQEAKIDVRVGTVDKFQGQEAPVVFYSMATSSGEDLPRGVNFLFEKNRLNVAISRAQCMSVLVASPRLLDVRCSSPEQIAMVNLLCRYTKEANTLCLAAPAA